ncbi:Fic family protein [Candidatus Woesearchaeota archaeon]|nr:Fic family protein [Candidatus Woesearchaeota archaeon]
MVTKYDVFEYMYEKGTALKPQEIASAFRKSGAEYHNIYKMLQDLEKNRFAAKNEQGFQAMGSAKSDLLFNIIKFCIANKINYNEILDAKIAGFICKAVAKPKFSVRDFSLNPRTFAKYVEILSKCGLLILLSKKPLEATIPYNSFLKDLAGFFGCSLMQPKYPEKAYLDEIESELGKFLKLRKKNNKRYLEIIEEYEVKFIQHSLNLEGNPITLPDTIRLLKDHIIPKELSVETVQEVQNYQKAIQAMIKDSEKLLTKESILNYHYLAMQHRPDIAGKLRTVPVYIKGNPDFKVASVGKIEPELNALLREYNSFAAKKKKSVKEILDFVSYFHNAFQHIHPFTDGNSRTTRLIAFHLLRAEKFPMPDIPLGLLEEYLFSTKGSKARNDKKLSVVLQRIILYNLKSMNEKMQKR